MSGSLYNQAAAGVHGILCRSCPVHWPFLIPPDCASLHPITSQTRLHGVLTPASAFCHKSLDALCHTQPLEPPWCVHTPLPAGRNPGLRVVLMSATADAGLFAGYFEAALGEPAGQLTIPGFTHPVTGGRCVSVRWVWGRFGAQGARVGGPGAAERRRVHAPGHRSVRGGGVE